MKKKLIAIFGIIGLCAIAAVTVIGYLSTPTETQKQTEAARAARWPKREDELSNVQPETKPEDENK